MMSQEGAPILAGKHSSQVCIYAMEYRQLVTTCTYTNLSQKNTLNRTRLLFSLRQHTTSNVPVLSQGMFCNLVLGLPKWRASTSGSRRPGSAADFWSDLSNKQN